MHVEGGAYVTTGVVHILDGEWKATAVDTLYEDDIVDTISVSVEFALGMNTRESRALELSAAGTGQPLAPQLYQNASRYPFSINDRRPGLDLSAKGRGCNKVGGWFEIKRLRAKPGLLSEVLATFEVRCDGLLPAAQGCVHYRSALDDRDAGEDLDAGY
jgi:hypothetical protein